MKVKIVKINKQGTYISKNNILTKVRSFEETLNDEIAKLQLKKYKINDIKLISDNSLFSIFLITYEKEENMNINRLKREIQDQTRNGRKEVYIKLEDLKELDEYLAGNYGEHRIMIEADYILELINKYEKNRFKRSLRTDTKLTKVDNEKYYFEEIEREER